MEFKLDYFLGCDTVSDYKVSSCPLKTIIFIVTAVRASKLTYIKFT
jgi:hypothetical protein